MNEAKLKARSEASRQKAKFLTKYANFLLLTRSEASRF